MSGGDKHPCQGCGYMMSGGSMCGDCREYGPPRGWRWQYDPTTDRHTKVDYADAPASVPGGEADGPHRRKGARVTVLHRARRKLTA